MAKKKAVPTHIPLQQGFGFEVCDAAGNAPPFLWQHDDVIDAVREIEGVRWVATDTEGTGLTDASMPVALSPADIAGLIGLSFLGGEAVILLGDEQWTPLVLGWLRSVGAVIRQFEETA